MQKCVDTSVEENIDSINTQEPLIWYEFSI